MNEVTEARGDIGIPYLVVEAPKPYRPSSGTEYAWFQDNWCCQCKHDQAFWSQYDEKTDSYPEDTDWSAGCPITVRAWHYELDDPNYPEQWQRHRSGPVCTAFVRAKELEGP